MRVILDPPVTILADSRSRDLARSVVVTVVGFSLYGFTVGFWRSPVMGCYVAVKMPLLIFLTLSSNGMLNGLLGILLGSGLGFRQSLHALLSAFAISGVILGSLAPITLFLALNSPDPSSDHATSAHASYLLLHTTLIGIAGFTGIIRLASLMNNYCPDRRTALSTLGAWIAGNAFLGAQFSWILRPFFGSPNLEVAFLRDDPMRGSFYEAVWNSLLHLASPPAIAQAALFAAFIAILGRAYLVSQTNRQLT